MQTESEFVTLCGGLSPPIASVRLALDLEAAGFQLSRDGDDILIRPFSKLTDEDKQQLKLCINGATACNCSLNEHRAHGEQVSVRHAARSDLVQLDADSSRHESWSADAKRCDDPEGPDDSRRRVSNIEVPREQGRMVSQRW